MHANQSGFLSNRLTIWPMSAQLSKLLAVQTNTHRPLQSNKQARKARLWKICLTQSNSYWSQKSCFVGNLLNLTMLSLDNKFAYLIHNRGAPHLLPALGSVKLVSTWKLNCEKRVMHVNRLKSATLNISSRWHSWGLSIRKCWRWIRSWRRNSK